jgi:L-amino acid N-acyltransferase YncA
MTELTNNDYKQILEYYNKPIPKSTRLLKNNAQQILAEKLCRCIKKIEPENEARSIGICSKTIFNRKGYTRGKFKCKGKRIVTVKKTIKNRN